MKVYILTTGPFPYGMASTARIKCYAQALQKANINCEVDVFERNSHFVKDKTYKKVRVTDEGFKYWYAGAKLYGSNNKLLRFINNWLDKQSMKKYLRQNLQKGDFVLLYFSDVKFSLDLISLIHKKGAFVLKELNEIPGKGNPSRKNQIIKQKTENRVLNKFDGIICISDALIQYSKEYISQSCELIKIPILVDFKKYDIQDNQNSISPKYIFHSGSLIERKDGILGMIEAFGKALSMLNEPILFYCTGNYENTPHRNEIKNLINKYNLQNKLIFTGYLSEEELKIKLSGASLVIINKLVTIQNTYCFSTKLAEYMAAAKPVIITNVGEATNWLSNKENAYIIEPNDIDLLADTIVYAINNKEERVKIGENGKKICRKYFDANNYSEKFKEYLDLISKKQK
ncbi:lipopolysaccharide 1%2C2-N-acetylglucosaminetransferase [uncultured Bacteroides sp.]|uniref:glycosyltransferase family 4 protein n=1 Tax=Bacteroides cellulolyticus TaxID=2981780 RepID=UPI000822445E|nr:glycosyltransferase [Bacteroides cellulolyticus]MCU6770342.1 glycosyltransferase [Bacteroides cellulolyticus]SCH06181.1 lipopolysaccharide 1%2C2-N-acetylglucosaminetransferase [uncultured Bacteroides sp.]